MELEFMNCWRREIDCFIADLNKSCLIETIHTIKVAML